MAKEHEQMEQQREGLRDDVRVYGALFSAALQDRRDLAAVELDDPDLRRTREPVVIHACE